MNTIVMQAELKLQEILDEHEDLLRLARGFGMRTAAIPSRLMPLAEARKIVAEFDNNTSKLRNFLSDEVLTMTLRNAPDKETKDALNEIFDRASKSLTKFEDHRTKARAAIAKHEDLLVGENFQDMFEALRLAVLDLDLTDKADFAAKTQLHLDATPAYAVGLASVWRNNPKEEVYKVRATYKAETDEYVADMWSVYSGRWFPAAKKTGHARIPAFVKAVADKLKAVHDLEGADLLGSRRKVDDTSKEVSGYRGEIESRKRRELAEKERNEAARRLKEVSQAIDRKLRQRLPKARVSVKGVWRPDNGPIAVENFVESGDVRTRIMSELTVGGDGKVVPSIKGFVGLFHDDRGNFNKFSVKEFVSGKDDRQYVDEAVETLVRFATPNPADTAKLSAKIEDVASQVWAILSKRPYYVKIGLLTTQVAKGIVRKMYQFGVRYRDYVRRVEVAIEASTSGSSLRVVTQPFGHRTEIERNVRQGEAAKKIVADLLSENRKELAELMAPHRPPHRHPHPRRHPHPHLRAAVGAGPRPSAN